MLPAAMLPTIMVMNTNALKLQVPNKLFCNLSLIKKKQKLRKLVSRRVKEAKWPVSVMNIDANVLHNHKPNVVYMKTNHIWMDDLSGGIGGC